MGNNDKYHIEIDGKGYLLLDESYAVQPQRPFNPRFSTGDPSFGDLSFFQFLTQEDFRGGEGQEIFSVISKYKHSSGWDLGEGKARLGYGQESLTPTASPVTSNAAIGQVSSIFYYGDAVVVTYPTGGAEFAITTIQSADAGTNKPLIIHVNADGGFIMNRDSAGSTVNIQSNFIACSGTKIRVLSETFTTIATLTLTGISNIRTGLPINVDKCLVYGNFSGADGIPTFVRVTFDTNAWTVAAEKTIQMDVGGKVAVTSCAKDADGTMYFGMSDFTANALKTPTRIIRIIAADQIATELTISGFDHLPNFGVRAIFNLQGSIYMAGAFIDTEERITKGIVKFPFVEVYRSSKQHTGAKTEATDKSLMCVASNIDSAFILMDNEDGSIAPILELRSDDTLREVAGFVAGINGSTDLVAAFPYNGRFYLINPFGQTLVRTTNTRGDDTGSNIERRLTFSSFGANTQLINKSLYRVLVELSNDLPSIGNIGIEVNGDLIYSIDSKDGKLIEVTLDKETVSPSFDVSLIASRDLLWGGYVKRITLQYIPTQLKKLSWGFAIRVQKNMRLLNKTVERRDVGQMMDDIKEAWAKNTPIKFRDTDGREYDVIMTEFKARQPLTADEVKNREYLIPIELLEV